MNDTGLKVLMISTDRTVFLPQSAVSERIKRYGELTQELHVIVFSDKTHNLEKIKLAENIFVYPTNSTSKLGRISGAIKLGKKIVYENNFIRGKSIITTQDPFECGYVGMKIKNKWRLPLEVQLHTDPFSPYFTGLLNQARKIIWKKVLKKTDSLRVVNKDLAEKISEKFSFDNSKINILPIYVEKNKFDNEKILFDLHATYSRSFILLMVARLTKEKNIPLALNVFSQVRKKFPEAGLVIVGEGPEEKFLKKLSIKLGIDKHVYFIGWKDNLVSYYRTANVFLQTSSFEGYGMALVEAGLAGLPVVTTPVGFANELDKGKDAYVCRADDLNCFTNSIIDLIENNQKRENLRLNMKKTLETKLFSKEEYLNSIKLNWEQAALKIS